MKSTKCRKNLKDFLASLRFNSKKGQGMSLNVIIIAALALVVLVVLIVIFTQQSTKFGVKVGEETKTELAKMRIFYGQCQPGKAFEDRFTSDYESATSAEDKDVAESNFRSEIDRCKEFTSDKDSCESNSGCIWS
ncbi:MAG: hypothetical protein KKA62_05610 [Nanoarchaeota archaeon]|nr:hypothetical protein [Nanoarchaeota archaeon]MBU1644687.1 hypothetical protein [Nanoarchaeota archaeon]MBU1977400.1 hypothetical protein [Nanoarchaeota archaeon]